MARSKISSTPVRGAGPNEQLGGARFRDGIGLLGLGRELRQQLRDVRVELRRQQGQQFVTNPVAREAQSRFVRSVQ